MTIRVAVFVGTRADLGPLSPVISALSRADDIALEVLTGVAYSADELTSALPSDLVAANIEIVELVPPLRVMARFDITKHGPALSRELAQHFEAHHVDSLVVLGDRWELLYVMPAAFLSKVPIVHLHGGEVTEGALDERVRHAVTKLADQHCVASEDAAMRVRQLGEPADRIHVTGAPGLDRIASALPIDLDELSDLLGCEVRRPIALFTYHPPTAGYDANMGTLAREAVLGALDHVNLVIATHPGMDTGRELILAALHQLAAEDPRVRVVPALGAHYPGVLHSVDVVVGNSSSGVIEAASAGKPVVDVGARQQGRLRAGNVIQADEGYAHVSEAVRTALLPRFQSHAAGVVNPYGDGRSSERIVEVVRASVDSAAPKQFVNLRGGHV